MRPHVELAQVWPRDGAIRLVGRLQDWPPAGGTSWTLLLALRGTEQRLRFPASVVGERVEATVPVEGLAAAGTTSVRTWDVYVAATAGDAEVRLRAGRHLDDIRGKKKIMVFPAQRVGAGERAATVRPYYTIKDNLSILYRPGGARTRGSGARRRHERARWARRLGRAAAVRWPRPARRVRRMRSAWHGRRTAS